MRVLVFLLALLLMQPAFSQNKLATKKERQQRREAMLMKPDETPPTDNYAYDGSYIIDADESPLINGGQTDFIIYLNKNMRYPESAIRDKVHGKVLMEVVVDKLGRPQDVKVVNGIREDLNEEAMRLVREMPRWIPGRKDGQPANVKALITVKFPPLSPAEEERQLKRSGASGSSGSPGSSQN